MKRKHILPLLLVLIIAVKFWLDVIPRKGTELISVRLPNVWAGTRVKISSIPEYIFVGEKERKRLGYGTFMETTGSHNIAIGYNALVRTSGSYNTAIGADQLYKTIKIKNEHGKDANHKSRNSRK